MDNYFYAFPNVWACLFFRKHCTPLSFAMAHYAFIQYITKALPKQQIIEMRREVFGISDELKCRIINAIGVGFLMKSNQV